MGRPLSLAVAAALLGLAAWSYLRDPREPPHVLIITIDTLRADALGPDTPALEELAARGVRFARVRAPAPLTLPSHATLLSGLDPAAHGLRDNTAAPLPADRGFPLLAEEFRAEGYATAAFVAAAVLDRRFGLDAGFETYRSPAAPVPGDPRFRFLDAAEQVERVERWFRTRPKDKPFFVWVHLWEPHDPYRPYAGDARRPGTAASDPPDERYRGEVRKADAAVERLLKLVDRTRTLVCVTSDHGEALGAHGERTHGHLVYGDTLDVPLLLAGPGVPAGGREGLLASLADIAPTLRRLARLPAQPTDGASLLALPTNRVVVGESLYAYRLYTWAQQSVATDGEHTLIDGGPRLELFDRVADPGETNPLDDPEGRPVFETLDRALQAYRNRVPGGGGAAFSPEASPYGSIRRPESGFLPPAENRRLLDVRDRLPQLRTIYLMRAAIAQRNRALVRELWDALEQIEAEDLRNPAPCLVRGRALLHVLDDPANALRAFEEARRRGYRDPRVDQLLAEARQRAGGG